MPFTSTIKIDDISIEKFMYCNDVIIQLANITSARQLLKLNTATNTDFELEYSKDLYERTWSDIY